MRLGRFWVAPGSRSPRLVTSPGRTKTNMLVAEDREHDVEILELAFKRAGLTLPMRFVRDGEEAIDYLKGCGEFTNRKEFPLPKMVLLDLNMPRRNGFEVLEWIRLQPGLRRLVVVMFTCSDIQADIDRSFELGANSYVVKPLELDKLENIARLFGGYWMMVNKCAECGQWDKRGRAATRVLLRDRETGFYFQTAGQWTPDPGIALDFETANRAAQFARGIGLGEFELLVTAGPAKLSAYG